MIENIKRVREPFTWALVVVLLGGLVLGLTRIWLEVGSGMPLPDALQAIGGELMNLTVVFALVGLVCTCLFATPATRNALLVTRVAAAVVSPHARVGAGSVVLARAVINIDAELGCACIINSGAVVEHDNRLADGVHVSPLAVLAGGVSVGEASWIGAGAAVRQGLKIGHDALVGLGAAAVQDVADGEIVAGVPARILETRSC